MASTEPSRGFRFSLRGLLAVIVFFAVACAALKFANDTWWAIVSGGALLLLMAMAVVAFAAKGPLRAFAVGYVICTLIYGTVVYLCGNLELSCYGDGRLPTSKLLTPIYTAVVNVTYFDRSTGKPVSDNVPPKGESDMASGAYFGPGGGFGGPPGVAGTYPVHRPGQDVFMRIGHLLWSVIFGWLGGVFAKFVYSRSERQTSVG